MILILVVSGWRLKFLDLHLVIFWISAICIFIGMIMAFYAEGMVKWLRKRKDSRRLTDRYSPHVTNHRDIWASGKCFLSAFTAGRA